MGWIADLLKEIPSATRYKAELEELVNSYEVLQTKYKDLETVNLAQKEKIRQLEEKLTVSHGNLLDEAKLNILLFLSKHDKVSSDYVAQSLHIDTQVVMFHLRELLDNHMVHIASTIGKPTTWYLAYEGRRYLIDNKLIS